MLVRVVTEPLSNVDVIVVGVAVVEGLSDGDDAGVGVVAAGLVVVVASVVAAGLVVVVASVVAAVAPASAGELVYRMSMSASTV